MNNTSLNNYNIDDHSFVCIGIDKITLGLESHYLNFNKSPVNLSHIVDIENHGNWSKLHIQLETNGISNINCYYPFNSVIYALQLCLANNFFDGIFAYWLNYNIWMIYLGWYHPNSLIYHFFDTGIFALAEYELFFDFYGYKPLKFNRDDFKYYKGTYYTKDYKKTTRANGWSKGVRHSLLCYYNRGLLINASENIQRLEFRIRDIRAKAMLNPYDLFLPLPSFIDIHCDQIKHTLQRYIPKDSIKMDEVYIQNNTPDLFKLIDF